jgi:hypothetical protein
MMTAKSEKTLVWMGAVSYGIATIGLVFVFGFYRKQTKPAFVKVIWAFITLGILNEITRFSLGRSSSLFTIPIE